MRSSLFAGALAFGLLFLAAGGTRCFASDNPDALPTMPPASPSARQPAAASPGLSLPLPDAGSDAADPGRDATPGTAPPDDDPAEEKNVTRTAPPLPVIHDLSRLPEPVRRMRELIEKAARSGDPEKLRPLLGKGATQTQLAISGQEGDPIAYLRSLSGDPGGEEILAILLDVLDAGFVDMDPGKPDETYVWPYFFSRPLGTLTAPQRVELLRIITAGDFADMKANGGYNFFRVGISPDGQWKFFVAGD